MEMNLKVVNNEVVTSKLNKPLIIAGPCSVESYDIMASTARFLTSLGVTHLRGGAYKPRTSPYSFQGLGYEGIKILKEIKAEFGIKIVSEIIDPRDIDTVIDVIDVLQIGSRNMYNYQLLKELGKTDKKILLKRAMAATVDEWIFAAEYIAVEGNNNIVLCERGIRTFETSTRNTLDLNCIPVIKQKTNLEVIVDPSHGTGYRNYVAPMSMASIAAGADGLIIEIHPSPDNATSDGSQTIDFDTFSSIYKNVNSLYSHMNTI